jgi:hypothetical protein
MSNCCSAPPPNHARDEVTCPVSGTKGAPVELQTVKALLTESALARLCVTDYRFCPDPKCDVVYFEAHGGWYGRGDLRVPVWHKEPFGARLVCYCFGETESRIRQELIDHGQSRAVERVRAHITAGRCACEVRNPRGACCLGDVSAAVKRVEAELRDSNTMATAGHGDARS